MPIFKALSQLLPAAEHRCLGLALAWCSARNPIGGALGSVALGMRRAAGERKGATRASGVACFRRN